ncbi:3663_t:CDS:1, partial [Racocetra persica]
EDSLQSYLSVQTPDELSVNRPDSSILENTSANEESNNKISKKPVYKKAK